MLNIVISTESTEFLLRDFHVDSLIDPIASWNEWLGGSASSLGLASNEAMK